VYEVFVTEFKEAETHAHRDYAINKIYFHVLTLDIANNS
jgi:hypothetical protein